MTVLAEQLHYIRGPAPGDDGLAMHVPDDLCAACLARAIRHLRGEPTADPGQVSRLLFHPASGGPGVLIAVQMQLCEACDARFGDPCGCRADPDEERDA